MKKATWIILAVLSVLIGLYPISYFVQERTFGLLQFKPLTVLNAPLWNIAFYGHIIPAAVALLIGWVQFNEKWRNKNLKRHRTIGKVYMISVLISGVSSLYIAIFATGGAISAIGFAALGVIWLSTTILGFRAIKNGHVQAHQKWMIYSYAACFAAVTLRIWLPILTPVLGGFVEAYRVVAWLCWVPNIIVAYFIIQRKNRINQSLDS